MSAFRTDDLSVIDKAIELVNQTISEWPGHDVRDLEELNVGLSSIRQKMAARVVIAEKFGFGRFDAKD